MFDRNNDKMQSFKEYMRQYFILRDVFGCRDVTPVVERAEILNNMRGAPKVDESEGAMLDQMAAIQIIIKSSIVDQAVWSWWVIESCPEFTDRKIDIVSDAVSSDRGFMVRCYERKKNARPELEVWAPVGEGKTFVEAVHSAAVASQFGGDECLGDDPRPSG